MKYIAFLRGIMPQLHPTQKMENLRHIFSDLGFTNVKSFIASGNIIFESSLADKAKLEAKIEKALKEKTGYETATILRTKEELASFVKSDPFKIFQVDKDHKPHVTLLKKGGEVCFTVDMLTQKTPKIMLELEKKHGKLITTRTWNTIQKINSL